MTPSFNLPADYSRIRCVNNFHELISAPWTDGVNALCWPRTLPGDFAEVVACLGPGEGIVTLMESEFQSLKVSPDGRTAIEVMLADLHLLQAHQLAPVLNCIHAYPRDKSSSPVPTDVFSFHADSATVPADTWLCTYHGAPSEGLRQDESLRRVDVPETRAELLKLYGGVDDAGFREFLNENCFDLHYVPTGMAIPFGFGIGNLWRIATEYPGCPVPPCVHRAPKTSPGDPPRLLLIS